MTIAVSGRIAETGLLRAIGAEQGTIFKLFLFETLVLSLVGGGSSALFRIFLVQVKSIVMTDLPM